MDFDIESESIMFEKGFSLIEFLRPDELASVIEKISKKIKGDVIALTII
ncbi:MULTISPECIES: DUF3898 domain-containing protein [Bacillaceae]|nr:DUF3898 domain-containing protein [Cytobacillus oceanisediminis]